MNSTEYEQIVEAQKQIPHFHTASKEPKKLPLVYQYRNFSSFWKIIKSDSFWATNARFSNDEAEQQFGIDVISSICAGKPELHNLENMGLDENYIVCFCRENDKLSQWRGYAPEGGVSLGFDFGMPRAFSVLRNDTDTPSYVLQYVGLDGVKYISPKRDDQSIEQYSNDCREQIALVNSAAPEDEAKVFQREIQKKAPFIKHSGFEEEDECRLVFRNQNGNLDNCICYRDLNDASLRYPYIAVKAALPEDSPACFVRVCIQGDKEVELAKKLEGALKATHPTLVHTCRLTPDTLQDADEPFCTGCVLRRWEDLHSYQPCRSKAPPSNAEYEYCLHEDENCIIISQGKNQREVFEIVHELVQSFCQSEPKISVWCEGHLPLRKITVGPCPNQSNMIEAIQHYCKHTYWLRDVKIEASKIPFRKSL